MMRPAMKRQARMIAVAGLIGAAGAVGLRAQGAATSGAQAGEPPIVATTELAGSVDPGSGAHLLEAIDAAREMDAAALIVRLDTPGGLLETTRQVVQAELSSKVPIVFWVGPPGARAGSAGVFLTLAAHVAAMAPSTNIGAAHPVGMGGSGKRARKKDLPAQAPPTQGPVTKDPKDALQQALGAGAGDPDGKPDDSGDEDVMASKIENDTAAFVRGIAERRSRNVEWAELAVRESVSITATEALERKVIDLIAEDMPELLQKLDGRTVDLGPADPKHVLHTAGAHLVPLPWSVKNRAVHFLGDPEIAYLIGMLGVLGILAELYHPGTIIPGVVGVCCIVIAGVGFAMVPVSGGALALILVGVGLLAAELYAGGHGGFIIAGIVCIVIGSLLLVGHVNKGFYADRDFGIGWREVAPIAAALGVIAWTLVYKVSRTARGKLVAGANALLGQIGVVSEALLAPSGEASPADPLYEGSVLVNGELWRARSSTPLGAGARARVLAVENLSVRVESA